MAQNKKFTKNVMRYIKTSEYLKMNAREEYQTRGFLQKILDSPLCNDISRSSRSDVSGQPTVLSVLTEDETVDNPT